MRICVTGGAGYIGSITTRVLLDAGHECVVLDTLERGYREAVDPRAELVIGDVADIRAVEQALSGCDAIMHLAGYIEVAESQRNPERYFNNNARGPLILLATAERLGITAFCFSSTAAVYGEPKTVPIGEDSAERPINAYGASKLAYEHSLIAAEDHGVRSVRFRYFNVAGAWPDGSLGEAHEPETHIIPRVLQALRDGKERFEVFGDDYPTRDGTCVRDYIHVCDLARAHLLALEHLHAGGAGGVFNLGNGEGFSNREIVTACARVAGREIEIVPAPRRAGDPAVLVASAERVREVLGWVPERPSVDEMVADAWRWHLARPDGYR